ncbi:MAG: nuclear transport factor 2 family protein [Xenococcaceae cyanobacterium MO_234.B1]|nr:nuclear transport factor 2 family protein [Xenococcaceae cyanobacterium MO_234.B1]
MSIEENKKIARDFCADFSNRNIEAVEKAMADTATWQVMGSFPLAGTRNKQEFVASLKDMTSLIPEGVKMTPKEMTAEGDRVAVEADAYGKLVNGKVYQNKLHLLMEIRDGEIQAVREYMDTYHTNEIFNS